MANKIITLFCNTSSQEAKLQMSPQWRLLTLPALLFSYYCLPKYVTFSEKPSWQVRNDWQLPRRGRRGVHWAPLESTCFRGLLTQPPWAAFWLFGFSSFPRGVVFIAFYEPHFLPSHNQISHSHIIVIVKNSHWNYWVIEGLLYAKVHALELKSLRVLAVPIFSFVIFLFTYPCPFF